MPTKETGTGSQQACKIAGTRKLMLDVRPRTRMDHRCPGCRWHPPLRRLALLTLRAASGIVDDTPNAVTSEPGLQGRKDLRLKVGLLLFIPWPMLYLGHWSLYHVKGPASDGFGMGLYASGIIAMAYGTALYALNRAIVYARQTPEARAGDRVLYGVAVALYAAGILGLIPMLFFLIVGFPYSSVGIILIALALLRWKQPTDESERRGLGR